MASMQVLYEVTGCILKQSDEKPAMKWSILTKIEVEDLASFLRNLKSCRIDQRTKEIGVLKYKLKLQYKRLVNARSGSNPEFARRRNIFNQYRRTISDCFTFTSGQV